MNDNAERSSRAPARPDRALPHLDAWVAQQWGRAAARLLRNVSPPGARPGAIVASPSRSHPDYYFHWVRDSAIAAGAIGLLRRVAGAPEERRRHADVLLRFVEFSAYVQETAVHAGIGLGQPKFTVTGAPADGGPQNDGPALRAIELAHFAQQLLDEGQEALVRAKLYDDDASGRVVKTDLEYVARCWRDPCIGLWEEAWGHHFFTQLVQRKALVLGAALATRLHDAGAAQRYMEQAAMMREALMRYWDPRRGYLISILDRTAGSPCSERRGLDSSVIVAVLGGYSPHHDAPDGIYPPEDEHVLATAHALEQVFAALYPVNDPARGVPAVAIGRFPDDTYDGFGTCSNGNPWSCLTIAFAIYHYQLARHFRGARRLVLTPASLPFFARLSPGLHLAAGRAIAGPKLDAIVRDLADRGDAFLDRVRYHENPDGSMSEQIDWLTGFQTGAPDLSVGYSAFLFAAAERAGLRAELRAG